MGMAPGGNISAKQNQQRGYPPWVRRMLNLWWGLFVVLAGSLLTNILLLPLANGLDDWWPGVQSQVAALLALRETQPFLAGIIVVVVPLLTLAGYFTHRAAEREEQREQEQRARLKTEEVVKGHLGTLTNVL